MQAKRRTMIVTGAAKGISAAVTNVFINFSVPAPARPRHLWAVLLTGGDGIRLRDLTVRIVGAHRPKQFSPIVGVESLTRHCTTY
jgi:hypothetical protein